MTDTDTRDERVAKLEARLQDGFTRIGEAMSKGVAVDNWEAHWVQILREYESIEDILREEPRSDFWREAFS